MPRWSSADLTAPSRRALLIRSAAALALAAVPWRVPAAAAADKAGPIRLSHGNPGSAGSIWRPLVDRAAPKVAPDLAIDWVGGDPGQEAVQLLAGALDVSAFGPIGVAEAQARGSDVVLIAPALNNHGSWIVRGDSPFRSPKDLRGKRIATQPETTETFRQARLAAALHGIDLKGEMEIIFGPPTANLALFQRGDVDGVITIEPTATRLIGRGAREIARVRDMWHEATGDKRPMFLVGHAARREWLARNQAAAVDLVKLYRAVNEEIAARPQVLAELHQFMGIPAAETAAIELLPKRLGDIYPSEWDPAVFAVIDHQLDVAVKSGILAKLPAKPVYAVATAKSG